MNVAIIDDERSILSMLETDLSRNSLFSVRAFSDPLIALEELHSWKPRVVLLDITMPQMDGIEVLKAIKSLHKDAKVIMMTGNTSLEKVIASHHLGADNYLLKPFESLRAVQHAIVRVISE
jgi:DNA-binding NtrC family response regulator